MRYFGGKGGAGVFQTILRNVPPHRVYVEAFAGGANVFERKARAEHSVLIEADPVQAAVLRSTIVGHDVEILQGDALTLLACVPWSGDEFVYFDPPYVHETRSSATRYRVEFDDEDHGRLLQLCAGLPVPFALSGYRNAMYDDASSRNGWRRVDFQSMTRGGVRTESLWMNYPEPGAIADVGYAGRDFRDRQRIKRKAGRWVARFQGLAAVERQAILECLVAAGVIVGDDVAAASSAVTRQARACIVSGDERIRRASSEVAVQDLASS